jgi:hypothetical protein
LCSTQLTWIQKYVWEQQSFHAAQFLRTEKILWTHSLSEVHERTLTAWDA